MSNLDTILNQLDKVKAYGNNKWLACCPAHNDKHPSLKVTLTDDGKILIKCWAGCDISAVLKALSIEMADLFPDKISYTKGSKPPKFNRIELFERLVFEALILYVAIQQLQQGKPLNDVDALRVEQAMSFIDELKAEVKR